MNRKIIASAISVVAVAAIVGGVYAATSAVQRPAEESPTIAPVVQTSTPTPTLSPSATPTPPPVEQAVAPAPEPPAEQAPVEQQVVEEQPPAEQPVEEPAAPIRCPAGSSANSNDGVNDTSCFPDICFNIAVPDPAHPECDVAFKP